MALYDYQALQIFISVAESASFTAAAERLNLSKARISLSISRFEKQLGYPLFHRTTRQIRLTEAGQALYQRSAPLLQALQDSLQQQTQQGELRGSLRISTSLAFASLRLAPVISAFMQAHPNLQIDLRSSDRIADQISEGIDLSFRLGWLRDSSQRAIKLGSFRQWVLAAPALFKDRPLPRQPADLQQLAWIAMSLLPSPLTWQFSENQQQTEQHSGQLSGQHTQQIQMKARLQVDSPSVLLHLLQAGAGVSVLEEYSAAQALADGSLIQLLPNYRLPEGGVYAVMPPGRYIDAKVKAFIDFYRQYWGLV